jgi:hypothetical protein
MLVEINGMDRASNVDIYKTTVAAVEEAAMVIVAPQEQS